MGQEVVISPAAEASGVTQSAGLDSKFIWTKREALKTFIGLAIVTALVYLAWILGNNPDFGSNASFSLLIGVALGILFERGRFCFFCIFRDLAEHRVAVGTISILVALATGTLGYSIVFALFLPVPNGEFLPPSAHISPVSWALVAGAFAFGLGMVLSGACIAGHLYRLGQGSLRAIPSLVGVVLGLSLGLIGWNDIYLNLIQDAPTIWLPDSLGYAGSLVLTLFVIGTLAVAAIAYSKRRDRNYEVLSNPFDLKSIAYSLLRKRWSPALVGIAIGVIGTVAYLRIEPLGVTRQFASASRTILETQGLIPDFLYGMDALAGCIGLVGQAITNNGWLILGLVLASFAAALAGGRFKIERLSFKGAVSGFAGGILLGWGALVSLGCTIGVLLSGVQAFSVSGWVFGLVVFAVVFLGIKLRLHTFA